MQATASNPSAVHLMLVTDRCRVLLSKSSTSRGVCDRNLQHEMQPSCTSRHDTEHSAMRYRVQHPRINEAAEAVRAAAAELRVAPYAESTVLVAIL